MNRWTSYYIWFILSFAAVIIAVVTSYPVIVRLILVALAAGAAYAGMRGYNRIHQVKRNSDQPNEANEAIKHEQLLLQMMGRMRHDLLNDLQILFGYIQLKKYDNLQASMEKIRGRILQDSNLFKLGIPSLIIYLLSSRCNIKEFELDIDLEEEINLAKLPINPEWIIIIIKEMIHLFQKTVAHRAEMDFANMLSIQFVPDDGALLLDFVFRGNYNQHLLEQGIEQILAEQEEKAAVELALAECEAAVTLKLPYQNV